MYVYMNDEKIYNIITLFTYKKFVFVRDGEGIVNRRRRNSRKQRREERRYLNLKYEIIMIINYNDKLNWSYC